MSALHRARQAMLGKLSPVAKTTTSRTISWMAFEQPNPALYTHLGSKSTPGSTTETATLISTTTDTKPAASVECKTKLASGGPKIRSPGQVVAPAITTSTPSPFSDPQKRTIHLRKTSPEHQTLNVNLQLKLHDHPATWPVQQPPVADIGPRPRIRQKDLRNYPLSAVWGWEEWKGCESPWENGDPAQGPAKRVAKEIDTLTLTEDELKPLRTLERKEQNTASAHGDVVPPDAAAE